MFGNLSMALLFVGSLAQDAATEVTQAGTMPVVEENDKGSSWSAASYMQHCIDEGCSSYNGNLTNECGACTPDSSKCHPGSVDYDTWEIRRNESERLKAEGKGKKVEL